MLDVGSTLRNVSAAITPDGPAPQSHASCLYPSNVLTDYKPESTDLDYRPRRERVSSVGTPSSVQPRTS